MLAAHLPALVTAAVVAAILTAVFARLRRNRALAKLGGKPPILPSKFLGIDEVITTMKAAGANKNRELWEERSKKWGHTLQVNILTSPAVLTDDPENIKAILAAQFHDFGKGEEFHKSWRPFLGDSIFTTDGRAWSDSRHLIRPQFIKDRVSDLHIFERHISRMLSLVPRDMSTFDISDLFFRFTLDSATDFLLGRPVGSLSSPDQRFATAFRDVQQHMHNVARIGPVWRLLPTRKLKRNLRVLNAFVEPFVAETLAMRADELKSRNEDGFTFLHALAQFTRDPRMLRDQLVAVLLAARDTTAGTLSWTLYELSKHPDVLRKLRAEILHTLGSEKAPSYTDLKSMRYLTHVLDETLRLYPAVPFNVRVALKDTYLPHGAGENGLEPVAIAKGTAIGYSTLTMQRREDLFGPDVLEFKPERWDTWSPKPWHYIPFNGGPRICLGQQFALVEMGYTLCRLLQKFETVEDRSDAPQFERCEITISPGAGVKVAMRPAPGA